MSNRRPISSWTDLDYAQAAIDMLPGTVEEIDALMRVHGIENKSRLYPRTSTCPIAQWVNKWTGGGWIGIYDTTCRGHIQVSYPEAVRQYVIYADRTLCR